MDGGQLRSKFLQQGHCRGLIVDEDSALPSCCDFTLDDYLSRFRFNSVLLENPIRVIPLGFKHAADDGLLRAMADDLTGSLIAQEQCEGANQNGFSGAGFAGKKIKSGSKLHREAVNHRVVFDSQFQQHRAVSLGGIERSVAQETATSFQLLAPG